MDISSLHKGFLEPIILKLLDENKSMYGYEITLHVKELTQGKFVITEGALYPLLHKLEAAGVLESEMNEVGNRLRKYYRITRAGKKEKVNALKALEQFQSMIQSILTPKPA